MPEFRAGQIIPLRYKSREIQAIIIDPNGLGPDKPSLGMGFRGMDRHTNVPSNTLSQRVIQNEEGTYLKLPSGELFRVIQISGEDGNKYQVIEASDWVALARDWAKNPGKLRKPARDGLIDFLAWFAAEGVYAQAYTILKRVYTRDDSQRVQTWIMSREAGKPARAEWGWEVQEKDPRGRYGYWTNYVYRGLFGMDAATMKETWANPVHGDARIARNYVPESVGLEAIAYCEKMVGLLDLDDIEQAHDEAIRLTQIKFAKHFPMA
ncbi:hypothetical protein IQ265_09250 [Nodosilinea sp. LEGE 06152]|uniref:hypothetical protein n=1 Tax=Nodosilinea sp. LEGE 06152 TaxID=2777966 RepID=UPI00187E694A|nr:hypothetical protein [Nodosilinea sp. LEGE 06152]MBE9157009.1 hypothetical protein [Nodosilinea sp. LEGE 06152]